MNPDTDHPPTQALCRRCGTCCRKGGPALHGEDRPLVENGHVPLSRLYTIRPHEPAYDNVADTLAPAAADILKIKSTDDDSTACGFYGNERKSCGIYGNRPWECRLLDCRQPEVLGACYRENRLAREDLLSQIDGLWELVEDHQQRCDYRRVAQLAAAVRQGSGHSPAMKDLMEIIRYDQLIRQLLQERHAPTAGMLDFLFGRQLTRTIGMFQLKLVRQGSQVLLQPYVAAAAVADGIEYVNGFD